MKSKHRLIVNNIIRETQLLESVGWDEEVLKELYDYMDLHFAGDSIISPKILLQEIENKFGEDCSTVLRKMFLEVSLDYGLFRHDPDVEN